MPKGIVYKEFKKVTSLAKLRAFVNKTNREAYKKDLNSPWDNLIEIEDKQSRIFSTLEDALVYASNYLEKGYAIALKFHFLKKEFPLDSPKIRKNVKRIESQRNFLKKAAIRLINIIKNAKSKMHTCKKCKSKINRSFLLEKDSKTSGHKNLYCPVCNHSLLTEKNMSRLQVFRDRIVEAREEIKNEEKKIKENRMNKFGSIGTVIIAKIS